MNLVERWWRVVTRDGTAYWTDVEPELLGAWADAMVLGPFVLEAQQPLGAVACRDALAKLVRAEYPSDYSLSEIAETWGEGLTDDERAALREWGQ